MTPDEESKEGPPQAERDIRTSLVPKVFLNTVKVPGSLRTKIVFFIFIILLGLLVVLFLLKPWPKDFPFEELLSIISMGLGLFGAFSLYLGIFQAYHYFETAVSVKISANGFSVEYRTGKPREFRWDDIEMLLSSSDSEPVNNPSKQYTIILKTRDGKKNKLEGLSWDTAEGIGRLYNTMHPNLSRIVGRARTRGASKEEAARLLIDLMVDGGEAYSNMPPQWR